MPAGTLVPQSGHLPSTSWDWCKERFARRTVHSLIKSLVNISFIIKLFENLLNLLFMSLISCTDEAGHKTYSSNPKFFLSLSETPSTNSFGVIPASCAFNSIFCPCSSVPVWKTIHHTPENVCSVTMASAKTIS